MKLHSTRAEADSTKTLRKPEAAELKPGRRCPEIPVAYPYVIFGSNAGATLQHALIVHELSIILGKVVRKLPKSRIRLVIARCPFPYVTEYLREAPARNSSFRMEAALVEKIAVYRVGRRFPRRKFPFALGWQANISIVGIHLRFPVCKSVRFIKAHMANRFVRIYFQHA